MLNVHGYQKIPHFSAKMVLDNIPFYDDFSAKMVLDNIPFYDDLVLLVFQASS